MGKKKAKKQQGNYASKSMLNNIDDFIEQKYCDLREEITDIQRRLDAADKKTRKNAKGKMKKNKNYSIASDYRKNRLKIINEMESTNLLVRITDFISDMGPIIITISRLICCLILSILSISGIKTYIKPETVMKLDNIINNLSAVR